MGAMQVAVMVFAVIVAWWLVRDRAAHRTPRA
jgi:ABC-type sulfate transport system permease component